VQVPLGSRDAQDLRIGGQKGYLRIATEEAFAPPELLSLYRAKLARGSHDIGFTSLMGYFLGSGSRHAAFAREGLADLGDIRLGHMDAAGIDHAVLALTAPGTQVLTIAEAAEIATLTNDRLADACRRYPSRLSALAAVGFENVSLAIREYDRAVGELGLKGLICNSHINGRYLDDQTFWPLLEAVEASGLPLYLHPSTPSNGLIEPLRSAGLEGAIFGFAVETSLHLLRLIVSGAFDRFPRLRVVVGHLGEALPFWFYRLDHLHSALAAGGWSAALRPLELTPSEYFHRNIWLTTSGMAWEPAIMFARDVMGPDRVMYAMDYPYEYVPDEVRLHDSLPISHEDLKALFQDIAIRVFALDADQLGGPGGRFPTKAA
jgi:2,3-dihydroxybenzoate decarboxylase